MKKFIRIGVDLAKNYFQVHALESEGGKVAARKLTRAGMFKFFAEVEPCLGRPAVRRTTGRARS